MAVTPRTQAGLVKFRPVRRGSRVALVAPASPFARSAFDAGVAELARLGLTAVYDDRVFEGGPIVAGPARLRAQSFVDACTHEGVDAVIAIRGGYGSAEMLPWLDAETLVRARTAFVGYSDVTSLHTLLNCHAHLASVHGAMIVGRIATGASAYDPVSFLAGLDTQPLGEMAPDGLEIVRGGRARGPLFGGTLTQLTASLGTPYEFVAPSGHILFLDEVGERPYRLRRLLTQLRQSGRFVTPAGIVFGQLPQCDEPGGRVTARGVIADVLDDYPGPVLVGFPSGHTVTPLVSMPLGIDTSVEALGQACVVFNEAAAG